MAKATKPAQTEDDIYSQFEQTSTKQIKQIIDEENSIVNKGRAGRIDIEEGTTKLRFFPKHKGEAHFMKMRGCHWLTRDDEGEAKRFTVPNGRIHGNLSRDIVEAYIEHVTNTLDSTDPEDATKIKNLTSYEKGGIDMKTSWMLYASTINKDGKLSDFGVAEIKKQLRDAIDKEMIIEDESEAIDLDPFTHPKTGKYVLISYNKRPNKKKGETWYTLKVSDKAPIPIPVDMLKNYLKATPLSQLPDVTYDMTDFEAALEGLAYYDVENEINLFESEEFQGIVEEVRQEIVDTLGNGGGSDDTDDETETTKAPAKPAAKPAAKPTAPAKKTAPVVQEVEEEEENTDDTGAEEPDQFEELSRGELIQWKADNLETYPDLANVKLLKSDDDEAIRTKLREFMATQVEVDENELPFETEEETEEEAEVVAPPAKTAKAAPPAKGKGLSLDDIKNQLKNKKK